MSSEPYQWWITARVCHGVSIVRESSGPLAIGRAVSTDVVGPDSVGGGAGVVGHHHVHSSDVHSSIDADCPIGPQVRFCPGLSEAFVRLSFGLISEVRVVSAGGPTTSHEIVDGGPGRVFVVQTCCAKRCPLANHNRVGARRVQRLMKLVNGG